MASNRKNIFYLKKGDTPTIQTTLTRGGTAVPLAGASVRFLMSLDPGDTATVAAAATIIDPNAAIVEYTFSTGETDTEGEYVAEWEVTHATGVIETYPDDSYNIIVITDDLG